MSHTFTFQSRSEADTERIGRALAQAMPAGVIGLDGPLGAGKTRLVQAIAAELGVDPREVVSPTFVLVHEYQAAHTIYHIDAYRLRDEDEFLQLGVTDYFGPPNLVLIEWAERIARCLPEDRLEIRIAVEPGDHRVFHLTPHGEEAEAAVGQLRDC